MRLVDKKRANVILGKTQEKDKIKDKFCIGSKINLLRISYKKYKTLDRTLRDCLSNY